jgi:hypothetical protein
MLLKKTVGTVGTLAHGAVTTAASAARHPIGTTALAAGFVKGAAESGIHLIRTTIAGSPSAPTADTTGPFPEPREAEAPVEDVAQTPAETAPERDLPGPDIVAAEVPDPDDLPEPVVIEAEPATPTGDLGEAFHTEPKAASRDSEHGGPAGDREEVEGYVEEILDPEPDEATPVWTSESSVDEPLDPVLDEAAAKAVRSEAEILQKGAEQQVE